MSQLIASARRIVAQTCHSSARSLPLPDTTQGDRPFVERRQIEAEPPTPGLAELKTPEGTFLIQERRSRPRDGSERSPRVPAPTYSSSPQMMALGGLIILGVLFASYTTKYDAAIGHVHGALTVPCVGFLALQLFLTRAAYRLFNDVRTFPSLLDFTVMRASRYLPATIPAVLIGYLVIQAVGYPNAHADPSLLPANLGMIADMIGVRDIDSSHWRLKIEIIQSVFVALLWFGPARRHLAVLLTLALAHCAFSIGGEPVRQNVLTLQGFLTSDGYQPFFVFGVALYQWTQDRSAVIWQLMMAVAAGLCFLSNTPIHGVATVVALGVLTLLAAGHLQGLGRIKWLVHLGHIAFPIYVVHFVMGFAVIHHLEAWGCPAPVAIAMASLTAIAVGKAINALFERPAERHAPALIKGIRALTAKGAIRVPQGAGVELA